MVTNRVKIMLVKSSGIPEDKISVLKEEFNGSVEFIIAEDNKSSVLKHADQIDALIGCPRHLFTEELLEKSNGSLKWVHSIGAGCEQFLIDPLVKSGITLTTGKIIQGPEVADHALALLLSLTRNIHHVLRDTMDKSERPIELRRKTVLIIGCGGIGTLIAERTAAFGMNVMGVDPDYIPMQKMWDQIYSPEKIKEALPLADVVIMAAPVTNSTLTMLGKEEFDLMKKTAYFINVSRGRTVDTEALAECLRKEGIKAAGLDVTDPEPLPDDHPLRTMENVIITPHVAGPSDKNRERSFELVKNNIDCFVQKRPFINVVNKKLGY